MTESEDRYFKIVNITILHIFKFLKERVNRLERPN